MFWHSMFIQSVLRSCWETCNKVDRGCQIFLIFCLFYCFWKIILLPQLYILRVGLDKHFFFGPLENDVEIPGGRETHCGTSLHWVFRITSYFLILGTPPWIGLVGGSSKPLERDKRAYSYWTSLRLRLLLLLYSSK